jgi:hypothetical protein
VLRGSRLVGLQERPDGIVACVEHDAATTEEITVQWLVGRDGYHSATREFCGIELAGHDTPDPWAVFDVTLAGWPPDPYEGNFAYFDDLPVILTALPGQRGRVYLRPSAPDSDLVAGAASTLLRYRPALRFENVENPNRFQCHTKLATRYRSGRVLLAGDAAHACSPAQGHGMNCGLLDAHNLAWKLARVCKGQSAHGLLDSYEIERRPAAEIVTASGDAFEQAQSMRDPTERRARDAALRATFANPTSRHHESIAEAELDIDHAGSPIVMGDVHPALAPGARLPDTVEVRLAGGPHRRVAHRSVDRAHDARRSRSIGRRRDLASGHPARRTHRAARGSRASGGADGLPILVEMSRARSSQSGSAASTPSSNPRNRSKRLASRSIALPLWTQ